MKILELLNEGFGGVVDEILIRAEDIAFDEAANSGGQSVQDDRIFAIAKQIISNEIKDPRKASGIEELIATRLTLRRG